MEIAFPPALSFTQKNTPMVISKDFKNRFKDHTIWVKRDDLTGMELSGNKVRKLDYILKDALIQGAKRIITCGSLQSNHCRTSVYMARKLGLECTLYLRGKKPRVSTGNFFLNQLLEPEIHYVTVDEYQTIETIMAERRKTSEINEENAYIIPEGGSNKIGVWGYINCFKEIEIQIKNSQLPIEVIVVATGSGGTHAGLLLGKILTKSNIEILSVNVCDSANFFKNKIIKIINDFKASFDYSFSLTLDDIKIYDGYAGAGYGKLKPEESRVIKRVAKSDGILLDPVYTVKAYLGLEHLLSSGRIRYKNILFIHTGGIFGIFPYYDKFRL